VEAALKLVRLHNPRKRRLVALHRSFHGRTLGALSLTGQPEFREPFAPFADDVVFVEPNDAAALAEAVAGDTAAVVVEAVLGEGGVYPLTDAYLRHARALTERCGALLVADEVQCGLGRTGQRFAYQWAGILPDVVTLAKPLAAGLPLGAVLMREAVARTLPPHLLGTTFGGGPLACRVALETLELIDEALPQARAVAEFLARGLDALKTRHAAIVEVRSKGMMFGVEFAEPAMPVLLEALHRGLLLNCTHGTVLRLLPPLVLTREQADEILSILDAAIAAVYAPVNAGSYTDR
jgi:acetylornithine/N-succinyldiaminopimelate aminotransferase